MLIKKICIGTAQFGMDYGISNISGKTKNNELNKIFSILDKKNINFLDTSMNYGDSYKVLKKYNLKNFNIISKIPQISKTDQVEKLICKEVLLSLKKLKIDSFYGILLHNQDDMMSSNSDKIYKSLNKLKKDNKIKKIGLSIYNFDDAIKILKKYKFDIIQCPYNVVDRRMEKPSFKKFIIKNKIEIHVRSIFMQGLLLMKKRPLKFKKYKKNFQEWDKITYKNRINSVLHSLNFVMQNKMISKIIIGVENSNQLKDILNNYKKLKYDYSKKIISMDINLINPNNWSKL